jgi:hypothetical protein
VRFPNQLHSRLASTVASSQRLVQIAHQRLNTIGSQVNALQPGDWGELTLQGGWSSTGGHIPARSRIQQNGVSWLIGHIEGGTVTDGTVIGTLAAGFFNETYAHSFTVNAITGAQAASRSGATASFSVPYNNFSVTVSGGVWLAGPGEYAFVGQPITTATAVNLNTPTATIDTGGNITISNVPPEATQLSFSEFLPLI